MAAQPKDGIHISEGNKPGVIQRVCKECEKDLQTTVENRGDEEQMVIQTKSAQPGRPSSTTLDAAALNPLKAGGQPLPISERSFFEQRMGHDFRGVRVHTDTRADELARAAGARAFTHGGHVVFRAGEYAPDTSAGRHLLAHELTHTVQQGASLSAIGDVSLTETALAMTAGDAKSEVPGIQRLCDVRSPPPMDCPKAMDTPTSGTPILFGINRSDPSDISPEDKLKLIDIAGVWHDGGGVSLLRIDGFASCDGKPEDNWPLSCSRAQAVAVELETLAVDNSLIDIFAHGETDQFSATSLSENRRAVVTSPPPETITSETVATSPGARTRTTIGVGEEVNLTHSPSSAAWTKTGGTLSAANGITVLLTAPDTAQRITVTAGAATISFDVLAPTSVAQRRVTGTGVKHTVNRPDSGIAALTSLGPDSVNFSNVRWRELDVAAVATPGAYSCNPGSGGHCGAGGCPDDIPLSNIVVAGKGTLAFPPRLCLLGTLWRSATVRAGESHRQYSL